MTGLLRIARKLQSVCIDPFVERMRRNLPVNSELEFSANILFHTHLVMLGLLTVFLAVFLGVDESQMDYESRIVFGPMIAVIMAVIGWSLWSLVQGHYGRARLLVAVMVLFGSLVPILLTGGLPNSVGAPMLIVLPAVYFCLYGERAGALAVAIVLVFSAAQLVAIFGYGVKFPDYTSNANPALNQMMTRLTSFAMVVLAFTIYSRANARLRAQRDAEREHLAALANEDPLTGLSNARYLHQRLDQACARVDRHGGQLAMLYVDFNGFKKINDDHGHQIGDKVLCKIAQRLRHAIRREDIVARLGGDEFAILAEFVKDENEVAQLVERVHHLIAMPVDVEGSEHTITASVGRVIYPAEVAQKHLIIEHADRAMYRAKKLMRTQTGIPLEA